ncbi:MAG: tetratricopeptide repeat protein, partial [Gammaproteobacteria bacterium]
MKSSTSDQSTDLANTVKILADSAKVLAGRGDLADAEQVYTQILAAAPYHVPALQFLARQAYTAGDYQKALSLTERAIESAPDFPLLYQNRALIYRQVGKLDAALESLDKALQIRPGFPLILLNKAMLLKDLGRREEALQMAITGWRLLPDPETMSNDSTIPEVRRALIKEVADLIRSSQLAMVDGELESVIKKFGRPALGRILSAVAIYAGLQLPANPKNSLTGTGALVIPNLSVEPVRSIDKEP